MLKNPAESEREILLAEFTAILCQVFPAFLLDVSTDNCQGALMDESRMIRTQMGNSQ
jgi:hypothetical protein